MSPEQEWEYEQKLDQLYFRLEGLVLEMFINVVQKIKYRNKSFADAQIK